MDEQTPFDQIPEEAQKLCSEFEQFSYKSILLSAEELDNAMKTTFTNATEFINKNSANRYTVDEVIREYMKFLPLSAFGAWTIKDLMAAAIRNLMTQGVSAK